MFTGARCSSCSSPYVPSLLPSSLFVSRCVSKHASRVLSSLGLDSSHVCHLHGLFVRGTAAREQKKRDGGYTRCYARPVGSWSLSQEQSSPRKKKKVEVGLINTTLLGRMDDDAHRERRDVTMTPVPSPPLQRKTKTLPLSHLTSPPSYSMPDQLLRSVFAPRKHDLPLKPSECATSTRQPPLFSHEPCA